MGMRTRIGKFTDGSGFDRIPGDLFGGNIGPAEAAKYHLDLI
jgi:hypothetical protein